MLNQLGLDFLSYFLTYLPTIFSTIIYIVILVFAVLMFKKYSYRYGITLMLSAILVLVSDVLFIAIQYPYLSYHLQVELGLSVYEMLAILVVLNIIFMILNMSSLILLVVSVYLIYNTHKKGRIE